MSVQDSQSFLDSLMLAHTAAQMLFDVIDKTHAELQRLGVRPPTSCA